MQLLYLSAVRLVLAARLVLAVGSVQSDERASGCDRVSFRLQSAIQSFLIYSSPMKCPRCESPQTQKNGHRQGRQNYRCKTCGRQFVESQIQKGYSSEIKQICLRMHRNGMGFREIERITGISHNTIINWVRQVDLQTNDSSNDLQTPDDAELERLKVLV